MITKTAELDAKKFSDYFKFIDQLREDGLITRAIQSTFKDKLNHLFSIRHPSEPWGMTLADHFPNKYGMPQISFHPTFSIWEHFDTMSGTFPSRRDSKAIPNLHLVFVGEEDGDEHKLLVSLSSNYITELPVRYFINGTCVSVIDVKNLRTVRVLIKRLVGQKLYND